MKNSYQQSLASALVTPKFFNSGDCVESDATMWDGEDDAKSFRALGICSTCPVVAQCLEWAIKHEEFGIFGGMTARARVRARREQGIALVRPQDVNRNIERLDDIASAMPIEMLAEKWDVSVRQAFRWRAEAGDLAA